jgi:hypothetical protein
LSGSGVQEQPHHLLAAEGGCPVQGCLADDRRAGGQGRRDDADGGLHVRIGVVFQEEADGLGELVVDGRHQRRAVAVADAVDIGTGLDQEPRQGHVLAVQGGVEGAGVAARGALVDVDAGGEEASDLVDVTVVVARVPAVVG